MAFARIRAGLRALGPVPIGLAIGVWWLLLFRTLGGVDADYGNFVTVAERLIAGDRLYVDVYENKDPLFHYLNATSRWISPLGSWLLGPFFTAIAGVAVWNIARSQKVAARPAFVVAGIATPIILTGAAYFPGSSHLPGVAICLAAIALACRQRWILAGVAFGLVLWLKIVLLPVGAVALLVLIIFRRSWRALLLLIGGALASGSVVGLVVAARGELESYLRNLTDNVDYSGYAGTGSTGPAGPLAHLARVLDAGNLAALATTVLVVALAAAFMADRTLPVQRTRESGALLVAAVAALVTGLAVIALTGLWGHHALALAPAVLLALCAFVSVAPGGLGSASTAALPALLVLSWLLAAMPNPMGYVNSLPYARGNLTSHVAPGREAAAILDSGPPTTYARVGNSRDEGHALGLREWTLACPRFAEEPWEPKQILDATLDCLPSADVILIGADVKRDSQSPSWNEFVLGVERIVSSGYTCSTVDAGMVCRRTPG